MWHEEEDVQTFVNGKDVKLWKIYQKWKNDFAGNKAKSGASDC